MVMQGSGGNGGGDAVHSAFLAPSALPVASCRDRSLVRDLSHTHSRTQLMYVQYDHHGPYIHAYMRVSQSEHIDR